MMGLGVHRFTAVVDDNLLCGICSGVLEAAVLTPCGHSFCQACLDTWLSKPPATDGPTPGLSTTTPSSPATAAVPRPRTCPECRSRVAPGDARPIHSVRNLINGLDITCEHNSRGCKLVLRLDTVAAHADVCTFAPVHCAGCSLELNRSELADHHVTCSAITDLINQDDRNRSSSLTSSSSSALDVTLTASDCSVSALTLRLSTLELQISRMRRDLDMADSKNRRLERELNRTRGDLVDKRNQLMEHQYVDFDLDYDYGYLPHTVTKLTCLIARFISRKPPYMDLKKTFDAVRRCYENYGRSPGQTQAEVHVLLATVYACAWFSEAQRRNCHRWMLAIDHHREVTETLDYNA